jgi:hypothetical protein
MNSSSNKDRKDPYLDLEGLEALLGQLRLAQSVGYEIVSPSSSPVISILMEMMVDMSLKIKLILKEGRSMWEGKKNPSLIFLDQADVLGNFKSVRIDFPQDIAFDPLVADWFQQLTLDLIDIKRLRRLPERLIRSERKTQERAHGNKSKSYHYHRRRLNRRNRKSPK